jgi:hypothetical protein
MAENRKLKFKNRKLLKKVYLYKVLFYPFIVVLDKAGIIYNFEKYLNAIIKVLGINKSVHGFVQYRDYAKWFKNDFNLEPVQGKVVFPTLLGANSNLTLINLSLAKYLIGKNLTSEFLICNSFLPYCNKDGLLKSRTKNFLFCYECWQGYKTIEKNTGLNIKYLSSLFNDSIKVEYQIIINEINLLDTLKQCIDYKYNDFPLGEITKKSVLRYLAKGKFELLESEIIKYKDFLKATSKYYLIMLHYFESNKVQYAILTNGTLAFENIVLRICESRQIPYMTYETFIGNNSIIYKKNDEVMKLQWDKEFESFYKKYTLTQADRNKVAGFYADLKGSKQLYAVLNKDHITNKISADDNYACLFTNLNFDTAVLGRHSIFEDMEDWIYSVIDYWQENNPDVKLVIRVHPGEVKLRTATKEFIGDKIRNLIVGNDKIILFDSTDTVNSYELIKHMKYGMVYSSTIGLEIAYAGKNCIVAGLPYYRGKPFVISPRNKTEYFKTIKELNGGYNAFKIDLEYLNQLTYYMFIQRTKWLEGIKVYTPKSELNSKFCNSSDIIEGNSSFFNELYSELSNYDL